MKLKIVEFETAKKLKEVGFDIYTDYHYFTKTYETWETDKYQKFKREKAYKYLPFDVEDIVISAPTQALVQMWLREKHKLYVQVFVSPAGFYAIIHNKNGIEIATYGSDGGYETYEQALEISILEVIKLI